MNFKKANIFTGWAVFVAASIVYLLTIEPTTSFWDCGEFITTAYKLQVGHPPGAPLFMLLGRLFSAFVPVEYVAATINIMSALSSSFTILFLFWTITHFGKKLAETDNELLDKGKIIAVMASGVVGGLAYTFSDSFWFSAVEGEVYAMSSLFTAAVFWAILKWETVSDGRSEVRWIILIAYLMGLSIGVHLLNLLAIPAICFVYYFKVYKPTTKGFIITGLVSVLILGVIQSGIIPGVVSLAGKFELLFVNSLGLPFNTGTILYALLVVGGLSYGLYYTHKRNMVGANTSLLAVAMILLGYTTFATIVIRSSANPPLDENNPENVFTLLSYLNREQYGDRPLLYGQYFNSPADPREPRLDGNPVYSKSWLAVNDAGRTVRWFSTRFGAEQFLNVDENANLKLKQAYIITDERNNSVVNYDDKFQSVFPRMHSGQENHAQAYKSWSNFKGTPIRTIGSDGNPTIINKPTFGENLRFFFRYQVNWMYWRYFMWNFAGRQNDTQGHGGISDGNWLSGINFIDAQRLGSQENLPDSMTRDFAYNRFLMLPLALGILGLIYQLYRRPDDWFITLLLFMLTGMAIVIYLNQTPFQPRERDYAYAGSFYAFAIWIGLGTYAIFDAAYRFTQKQLGKIAAYALGAGAVVYMIESAQGDKHYFSLSILYMSAIVLIAVFIMYFLAKGMKNTAVMAALAALITLPVPIIMAAEGWNDHNRSDRYTAVDFAANYLETCEPNSILFTNGDNDTFPLWYAQEVEGIRTDVRVVNLSLLNTDWYINQMRRKVYESDPVPFSLDEEKYRQGTRDVVFMDETRNTNKTAVPVGQAIDFIANDENLRSMQGEKISILPTKNFSLPVDREKALAQGLITLADSALVSDKVEWRINRSYLLKNNLMVLDFLATNDWERPIYFAVTTGPDSYINLQDYFKLEGLAYRLTPVKTPKNDNPNTLGGVNTERMYDNIMNKFKWGGIDGEEMIYMDENNLRLALNIRLQFAALADQLIVEEKTDKALDVLDKCMSVLPEHNVPYDRFIVPILENYYKIGENEKANAIARVLFERYADDFDYYMTLDAEWAIQVQDDIQLSYAIAQRLNLFVSRIFPQDDAIKAEFNERFEMMDKAFEAKIMELEKARTMQGVKF
jgi:hypothetical protein